MKPNPKKYYQDRRKRAQVQHSFLQNGIVYGKRSDGALVRLQPHVNKKQNPEGHFDDTKKH